MYWKALNRKVKYTAKDIKEILQKDNVEFAYRHILYKQYFNKI